MVNFCKNGIGNNQDAWCRKSKSSLPFYYHYYKLNSI